MSLQTVDVDNFKALFLNDVPFLDVRAPVEFSHGSFAHSYNLPILNDDERHQVGICYKQQGQQAAIALGYQLVAGEIKSQRIKAWCEFAMLNPDAHLYCWRGGMRSNLTQQLMAEEGVDIPLIEGGYKALRNYLMGGLEQDLPSTPMLLIGGRTGSAKTPLINSLVTGLDLEGYANHRGSSFGRRINEPPSQVNFENILASAWLKNRTYYPDAPVFLEDESRRIGPVGIPLALWRAMVEAPVVELEVSLQDRVQHILKEYVVELREEYEGRYGRHEGFERYSQHQLAGLDRIRKKLGSQRHQALRAAMVTAFEQQLQGCLNGHADLIETLLKDYYDPMYDYQLKTKGRRIVFKGDYKAVQAWAENTIVCS